MAYGTTMTGDRREARSVRIWDPVVRIFHWALVAGFLLAWFSVGSGRLHDAAGYVVLGLVLLRLVWGFVGTRHARFSDFVPTRRRLTNYLRAIAQRRAPRYLGHNPAGGAMIVVMLAMLILTAVSGWMMVSDAYWGVVWVEDLHAFSADALVVLIAGHLTGVVVSSRMHRENLVIAMFTGRKRADD